MPKMMVKAVTTIWVNCILRNLRSYGHQLHQKTGVNFLFLQNENLAYIFGNDCK